MDSTTRSLRRYIFVLGDVIITVARKEEKNGN